jgi:hypothetical protein
MSWWMRNWEFAAGFIDLGKWNRAWDSQFRDSLTLFTLYCELMNGR